VLVDSILNNANTIDLSTLDYAVGDIIVMFAFNAALNTTPAKPTPGGTVPTFTDIDANTGAGSCASRCAYFVAANTSYTSGTWSASGLIAVSLRGQAASPIGGHAEAGAISIATAPAVTMTETDGSSILLHFFGRRAQSSAAWAAAPTGYTQVAQVYPAFVAGLCIDTKDVTTSDGSVQQNTVGGSSLAHRGQTVEILAV
jgi:hypothetical protein